MTPIRRTLIASAPTGEEALTVARLVWDDAMPKELTALRGEATDLGNGRWRVVVEYGFPEAQQTEVAR